MHIVIWKGNIQVMYMLSLLGLDCSIVLLPFSLHESLRKIYIEVISYYR